MEFEGNILAKLIPSFKIYKGDSILSSSAATLDGQGSDASPDDSGIDITLASERLAVALMTFLKYFCTNMGPIVMFLDEYVGRAISNISKNHCSHTLLRLNQPPVGRRPFT